MLNVTGSVSGSNPQSAHPKGSLEPVRAYSVLTLDQFCSSKFNSRGWSSPLPAANSSPWANTTAAQRQCKPWFPQSISILGSSLKPVTKLVPLWTWTDPGHTHLDKECIYLDSCRNQRKNSRWQNLILDHATRAVSWGLPAWPRQLLVHTHNAFLDSGMAWVFSLVLAFAVYTGFSPLYFSHILCRYWKCVSDRLVLVTE